MEPGVAHVALVTAKLASSPVLILIESNVPHFGAISAEFSGQVLPGEASVHAKNKFLIVSD